MALWGRSDTLAAAPKFITRKATFDAQSAVSSAADTIDLTNSNTNFATGDGVVYTGASGIGLTNGTTYYVKKVDAGKIQLATTEAGAKAGATGINLTAGATGAIGNLQRNVEGNEGYDHTYNGQDLYFIDADEAAQPENRARGLKHPGWWSYRSYTNADGSVAHHAECIVAMTAYTGATGFGTYQAQTGDNNADDPVVVDATVSITAQPTDVTETEGDTASFSVVAAITGAGALTYQWQESTDGGDNWSNLSNAGVYSDVTTADLVISDCTGLDGNMYRVVVGATTGNTDVTSDEVTLTVEPL